MNRVLVLKTKTGKPRRFEAGYAFIIDWTFCDADSQVILHSQNAHGPYLWELFDIGSGKLLDTYYRSKAGNPPEWVKVSLKSAQ